MSIQKGDYKIGDKVKILWKHSILCGEEGIVVELRQKVTHILVTVKVGKIKDSFGLKSSLKKIVEPEKVVFT